MLETIGKAHNSFLAQSAAGKKILVIVPHEDDEINVAGSVMYSYVQKGADVYCAFTTNGDFSFSAATRMKEAKKSLTILGVQHIIFLGYGDTSNHYKGGHLFYTNGKPVVSPSGHKETYGSDVAMDYSYQKCKKHSAYCRQSMKNDIKELILDVHPDIIFCVDLDVHSDHRAASILFEEAMGEILRRPDNTYQPAVFKGFAYCTSFGAPKDFYTINIQSVPLPASREDVFIGKSLYTWENRVRIPVLPECRGNFLRNNILYKALFQHASQSAALHAVRVANADAVFWQRRTDNLVYQAHITGSSGNCDKLADFNVLNIEDINAKTIYFSQYLWVPAINDREKILSFRWATAKDIAFFEIAGNIEDTGIIKKVELSFSDGTRYILGPILKSGAVLHYSLPSVQHTTSCYLRILEAEGINYGISMIGFYEKFFQENTDTPYIKIMYNDEFIYDYILPSSTKTCQLSVYCHATNRDIIYRVMNRAKSKVTTTGTVLFAPNDRMIRIRAEIKGQPYIYDEVCIHRKNSIYLYKISFLQKIESIGLNFFLRKYRKYTHIRHKYLKRL